MMKIDGEIVLIDKDEFEVAFFEEILTKLNLSIGIKHFKTPVQGLDYLRTSKSKIFVVISLIDFGAGSMSGLDLKRIINEDTELLLKSIPFVFMTYLVDKETIEEAYQLNIQGYFAKPMTLGGTTRLLTNIINYWSDNLRPDELVVAHGTDNKIV